MKLEERKEEERRRGRTGLESKYIKTRWRKVERRKRVSHRKVQDSKT